MRDHQGYRDGKVDVFAASTPPLKAKAVIFAECASSRRRNNTLLLSLVDIRKAYSTAIPERAIYMKLLTELGLGSDRMVRAVRCV